MGKKDAGKDDMCGLAAVCQLVAEARLNEIKPAKEC